MDFHNKKKEKKQPWHFEVNLRNFLEKKKQNWEISEFEKLNIFKWEAEALKLGKRTAGEELRPQRRG